MASSLMSGKRGLVMGVANDHSIAWGIAKSLSSEGAELAFTYQGEALGQRVAPLAESLGARHVLPCDVEDIATHPLLPISHVARSGTNLLSVLVIDRVLPPIDDLLAASGAVTTS